MCPECFLTLALLVTGVVSTGGVTAAAVKIFRTKKSLPALVPGGSGPGGVARVYRGSRSANPESQEEGEK
jgi:hypothetical protein